MATKVKVLNNPMVGGQEDPEHKAYLQRQVDGNAPPSEAGKHMGKVCLERNDQLILGLFDVDKIKYVADRVDSARGVKILIDVFDHFEPLFVKSGLFEKQVGDRGLDVIVDDLLPPVAGNSVTL